MSPSNATPHPARGRSRLSFYGLAAYASVMDQSGWPACMQPNLHYTKVAFVCSPSHTHVRGTAGAGEELKLGDFGLTMSMKQELAISPVGTVEYMAPEVHAPRTLHAEVFLSRRTSGYATWS